MLFLSPNDPPATRGAAGRLRRISPWFGVLVFAAFGMLVGCRDKTPTPAANQPADKPQVAKLPDDAQDTAPPGPDSPIDKVAPPDSETLSAESVHRDLDDNSQAASSSASLQNPLPPEATDGTWTTRRLIALAPGGPALIDLTVSVGGRSLADASTVLTEAIAEQICEGLEQPASWEALLAQPLVQSGWLGNLVAEEDQVEQLISMYDTERDGMATLEELAPFLSRGLARNAPLQISDIGNAPGAQVNQTPWGVADQNQDHTLDAEELNEVSDVMGQFDYNGDAIVSLQELNQSAGMQPAGDNMAQMSLLDTTTLVVADGIDAEDSDEARKAIRKMSTSTLSHYTFLEGIPREQWQRWPDHRWEQIDSDQDQLLNRIELEKLAQMEPDAQVIVRFPSLDEAGEKVQMWAVGGQGQSHAWHAHRSGGRLDCGGCVAQLQIDDAFSGANREILRQRLEAALSNPQLRAFFVNRLQLQEDAFDLVDRDEDQKLSDEEFEQVWGWLSTRQGTRLLARWMTAARPWFQLIDLDGDQRLTPMEMGGLPEYLAHMDGNQDQLLTPNELPLLVRLELRRTDNRLDEGPLGLPNSSEDEPLDTDWFSAMDTNRDGFVGRVEFLGGKEDFSALDINKDGFLARSEVYAPPDSY